MARIRAFRGYRYQTDSQDISSYLAPPYDVLSEAQRDAYAAANPLNVVELELAKGALDLETPNNRYETAATTWNTWKHDGTLAREDEPVIYVLEQQFFIGEKQHARTAFIVETQLHDFAEKVILPHERTLPKALGDRYRLTQTAKANFSQVFCLYSDPTPAYATFLDLIKSKAPEKVATDQDGVVSRFWVVRNAELIERFTAEMANKQLFIADGHHRYTTALAYRDAVREQRYGDAKAAPALPDFDAEDGSEYVMMALVNMDDPQLVVLPYHRAALLPTNMTADVFIASLRENFSTTAGTYEDLQESDPRTPTFLLDAQTLESPLLLKLKNEVDPTLAITTSHSRAWKQLDYAILQELVLAPLLGIHPDKPETLTRMSFSKEAQSLRALVKDDARWVAFSMRPIQMEQLQAVSLSGETMPQKSTYFYPKLPSGLVFRDIESR